MHVIVRTIKKYVFVVLVLDTFRFLVETVHSIPDEIRDVSTMFNFFTKHVFHMFLNNIFFRVLTRITKINV